MAYFLERMDEVFELIGFTTDSEDPNPANTSVNAVGSPWSPTTSWAPPTANLIGADRLVWAFDYPHSDSCEEPVTRLKESLASLPRKRTWPG